MTDQPTRTFPPLVDLDITQPPEDAPILQESKKCPHCGASMKMYWHKITPGLIKGLLKLRKAVALKGTNDIKIDKLPKEWELTKWERANWSKLRFHGLVAKVKDGDQIKRGRWLLTLKGSNFIGGMPIPERVQTFRNKVTDHSPEQVTISQAMHSVPYWQGIDDIEYEIKEVK